MREHQEHAFDGACAIGAGAQVRGEATLGAAEHAFGLPSLAVFLLGKVALHLAAVRAAGLGVRMSAMIDRDDRFANSPLFVAAPMVLFGIVRSVRHEPTNRDAAHRFLHHRQESRCVVARATTDDGGENEVTAMVDDRRELRPPAMGGTTAWTSATIEEVTTDIVVFQTGGIDRGFAGGREQAELLRSTNDRS
jgi:hypothetical protein